MAVSQQDKDNVIALCAAAGYDAATCGRTILSRVCGLSEKRARGIQTALRGGEPLKASLPQEGASEIHEHSGDTWVVTIPKTRITTLEQLIKYCKVDTSVWEVERWVCNKWEVGAKSKRGGIEVEPLFQVKAWLRLKRAAVAAKAEIAALKEQAKELLSSNTPAILTHVKGSGLMLEVGMPDLHIGKLAWAEETGWENYDSNLAVEVADAALEALLQRTSSYAFDKVLLVVGNDLLHVDNKAGTTTSGTHLAAEGLDGRYQKNFKAARSLITRHIQRLRSIGPVTGLVVPGNHDQLSSWCLGDSLECFFHNYADVVIDNAPSLRKYVQWGKVMLMFAHGNRGKLQDYPLVMAAEQPVMFGGTVHREAHTGDKHQLKVQELHGIRVRISPALCPPDFWHAENCYVGNQRSAEAFVWDREEGMIGSAVYTVPSPVRREELRRETRRVCHTR